MKRIKVLHIAQSDGGVAQYLKMYFKYCNNNKFENILLGSQLYNNQIGDFEELGIKVYLESMERDIKLFKDIKSLIRIYFKIKEINPDIIYCHSSKAGVIGRLPAIIIKVPIIYNAHGWSFNMNGHPLKIKLFRLIEKILARKTTNIIAISESEYFSALDNSICNKEKIELIKNGLDINECNVTKVRAEILQSYNLKKDLRIIGMVARVSEQKDPNLFVDIAKNILKRYDNVHFMYVGDGDMRQSIEQRIIDEGLQGKITITGWVNDPINYINTFDIALLTSKWEGFGLVILEYMMMDKPVIACNVGGISNIIDNNVNGVLIEDRDYKEFSNNIDKLINDCMFRKQIIKNAKKMVIREFDVRNLVKKHEILISKLVEKEKV